MTSVRLGELCAIRSGGTPSRSNSGFYGGQIPWAKISDIEASDGVISETEETISQEGLAAIRGRTFPRGTLLFAIYGSIGKMAFAGRELSTNQAILGIENERPDALCERYLFRYLESRRDALLSDGAGIAQKNLSAGYVRDLEIPLPPIAEQKRIAAILDQADELRRKRQRAIDRLNKLGQAIFHEMFGDIGRLDRTHAFSDVAVIQQSLVDPKLPEYSAELHVGPEHIASGVGNIAWDKVRTAAEDNVISGKNRFKSGDIIYSKIRPYLNKVAIADRDGLCSADMYVMQPKPKKSNAPFLRMLLMGADFLAYAETCSNRANIPKLNRTQVEGYRFHCPSFDAQQKFAERMAKIELMSVPLVAAAKTTSLSPVSTNGTDLRL